MGSFRQIDEKHVADEIKLMEWSPKMDLIALALKQGEVALHRLSWQKVWTLPALPGGDHKQDIQALSWRPDGKVLAVAYDLGRISLCDSENGSVIHSHELKSCITSLTWVQSSVNIENNAESYFKETSSTFLPKLPPLSNTYSSVGKSYDDNLSDVKKIADQTNLNLLVAGTLSGSVHLYTFGIFPSGELNVTTLCPESCVGSVIILFASVSEDLSILSVLLERNVRNKYQTELRTFQTPLLSQRHEELKILALKFGCISALMTYLDHTIKSVCEAWEDILLEIDSKLTSFAEQKHQNHSGTVSDDFLELLIFGTATVELEKFLLTDLTEKGLKKLGHSIELSYSNIQKLVLKHLQNVGQALMFHLSEIRGMSLWYDQFGILGLNEDAVNDAIRSAGSFMMKATEIQQVCNLLFILLYIYNFLIRRIV
ncbi:ANAPC4 (predicted) [Pycnogonum litorale]